MNGPLSLLTQRGCGSGGGGVQGLGGVPVSIELYLGLCRALPAVRQSVKQASRSRHNYGLLICSRSHVVYILDFQLDALLNILLCYENNLTSHT